MHQVQIYWENFPFRYSDTSSKPPCRPTMRGSRYVEKLHKTALIKFPTSETVALWQDRLSLFSKRQFSIVFQPGSLSESIELWS